MSIGTQVFPVGVEDKTNRERTKKVIKISRMEVLVIGRDSKCGVFGSDQ